MLIYRITNRINGKVYIGKWQGKNVQTRWEHHRRLAASGGGFYFHNAIRKHGPDAFVVDVIATAPTKEELAILERSLIADHQSTDPQIGYNIAKGGEGGFSYPGERNPFYGRHHSEETKAILREKCRRIGWKPSEETCKKISDALKIHVRSEAHCEHISEAKMGVPLSEDRRVECAAHLRNLKRTPEWGDRIGAALKGKPKSAEHRRNLSGSKRKPIIDRLCPICEVVFPVPDKVHSKKCCSRKCARKLSQNTMEQLGTNQFYASETYRQRRSEIAKAMWAGRKV